MALETSFRRFILLPRFIQTGNGDPRNAHWLGNEQPAPSQNQPGTPQEPSRPKRRAGGGYRDLATLTLGEVDDGYRYFQQQLVPSPAEGWIARDYFCQLPLKRRGSARPPVVFGRVKTCYPSDGHIHNIEELEVYFPVKGAEPDVLHIHQYDLAQQKAAQSYCVGVKMYVSAEEMADFSQSENIFLEKGFAPLYENGYLELLDLTEREPSASFWLYVIGSRWFASIPDSVQPEIREQLRNLIRWRRLVFNYHPRRYSLQYPSLNEELDFNYGFTPEYLTAPQDTAQVLRKLDESFAEIFMRGIG